jgi:hypothetical protein
MYVVLAIIMIFFLFFLTKCVEGGVHGKDSGGKDGNNLKQRHYSLQHHEEAWY